MGLRSKSGCTLLFFWAAGGIAISRADSHPGPIDRYDSSTACSICGFSPQIYRGISAAQVAAEVATGPTAQVVSVAGQTAVLELSPGHLSPANLADLEGRTIRFTPEGTNYRTQSLPLQWDTQFGGEVLDQPSTLVVLPPPLAFPFSGTNWNQFYMGTHGNITFGADQSAIYDPGANRFFLFSEFAGSLVNNVPCICPLFRKLGVFDPDGVGHRYAKVLPDRAVLTWIISEPYRDVFAFTTGPRVNRFQAVLYSDGRIDLSYDELLAEDGIVGVFPMDPADQASWTLTDAVEPALPGYLDVIAVYMSVAGPDRLRVTFRTREAVLLPGDPALEDVLYRIFIDLDEPYTQTVDFTDFNVEAFVYGADDLTYQSYSPHVDASTIVVVGNTVSFDVLTAGFKDATKFSFFIDAVDFNAPQPNFDQAGAELVQLPQIIGGFSDPYDTQLPPYLDVLSVAASMAGNHSIRFTFNFAAEVPPPGDPILADVVYRVFVDLDVPYITQVDFTDFDREWGFAGSANGPDRTFGPGVSRRIVREGPSLSIFVPLFEFDGITQFAFFVDAVDFTTNPGPFDQAGTTLATIPAHPSASVDLSVMTPLDPARQVIYEAFHYADVPDERLMSAAIIATLGDKFDFFSFYTDFRIDRQESGAVFSGAIGNAVSGVVLSYQHPQEWGSAGRLQGAQATSYIGAPISAQTGIDLSGAYEDYDRQVTLLSHELGHRWLTLQFADVSGQLVRIGDAAPHWLSELHAPVLFPRHQPQEASAMGGSFWQNNGNGTFTNFTQPFFQSGGYSPMDLYLMGFLPENLVASFFLLENRTFSHYDGQGHPVYNASPRTISLSDVTDVTGPRLPAFPSSQKVFNLGLVGIVAPGQAPSSQLSMRLAGIRSEFADFWDHATGGVSDMQVMSFGDADVDGDADLRDAVAFQRCFGQAASASCAAFRIGSSSIGLGHARHLSSAMTGP